MFDYAVTPTTTGKRKNSCFNNGVGLTPLLDSLSTCVTPIVKETPKAHSTIEISHKHCKNKLSDVELHVVEKMYREERKQKSIHEALIFCALKLGGKCSVRELAYILRESLR